MVLVSRSVDLHHSVSQHLWKELTVLQTTTGAEFHRQHRLHRRQVGCRKGCDACCHTLFSITEIEAAAISRAVRVLSPDLLEGLRKRSRNYLERRHSILEIYGYREGRGELSPREARLPCPALVEGSCAIYRDRPTLCRLYGVALIHPNQADRVFACQLNFTPGQRIEDSHLRASQQKVSSQRAALDRAYTTAKGRRFHEPVTVAHALLEDFEPYLPPE
jgi:Fe-S-cluster containining protein